MERKQAHLPTEEVTTNTAMLYQGQLVTTKFLVPVASHTLIPRPRLAALLQDSLKYAFTLVSAPAGFGKTTLLATWGQSLPAHSPLRAWVSLDEGDNDPQLFWAYVISALNKQQPERFSLLLRYLQSSQDPSLKYVLRALINVLADSAQHFVLILDDYHLITEQEVHTALLYLVEHLPPQLRIILATRTDPPLPLTVLQASQQLLKVCTNQLRCTVEETRAFFHETMAIQLPDEIIQQVTARTEGWLVGLQLLGLVRPDCANPKTLLEETSGDQRYILDYLTEEVLRRQPENVQTFLFSTCILEKLTASLCDAVMQQKGSQQMLEWLENANVFVSSVDSKRQWYRYHVLFAEALRYQLKHMHGGLMPILHHRASLWYAEHGYTTEAILHAFNAHQWQWAADLIEGIPLISLTWRASEDKVSVLRQGLEERLPVDLIHSRPRLCLACAQILWAVAPQTKLEAWFDAAETCLTNQNDLHPVLAPEEQQAQDNLLGEIFAFRAVLQSYQEDGQAALSLCQRALSLLSAKNFIARAQVSMAHLQVSYLSSANDTVAAIQSGLEAGSFAQAAGQTTLAIAVMGSTVMCMIGAGQLHEAQRLSQQAMLLGDLSGKLMLPEIGYPAIFQAEILREWNQLDAALSLAEEGISLCKQGTSIASLTFSLYGHAVLMRIFLSRGELDAARSALQEFEHIGRSANQPTYLHVRSLFTTIDQVRLWLVCEEHNRALRWDEQLALEERRGTPFAREREEVAWARILLARGQPVFALERLESVLVRATAAQRWRHVIEVRLLQALAYYMHQEETLALSALSEAVRLAEPEAYICSFVDEGTLMAMLLFRLREEQRKAGPTPYLDVLLAAFPQRSTISEPQPKRVIASEQLCRTQARGKNAVNEPRPNQVTEPMIAQPLVDPLSDRELEVLQLLARGASNQEIAQELVIVVDTVKRHVSQIFSKLAVKNRVQAVRRARALDLLSEEP